MFLFDVKKQNSSLGDDELTAVKKNLQNQGIDVDFEMVLHYIHMIMMKAMADVFVITDQTNMVSLVSTQFP